MKRNWYAPEAWLWEVTLARLGEEADYRSPVAYVVAPTVADAAAEAREVMAEAWKDEARWLRVAGVKALHPVHGISPAPLESR